MRASDTTGLTAALAPVRAALLAAARADAEQTRARAEAEAAGTVAAGERAAARIREEAWAQGAASGAAAASADRIRARRQARAEVLRAQREAYLHLRAAAREGTGRLRAEPGYPALRRRLETVVARRLGAQARLREGTGGGVVGEAPGRRLDYSLAGFADRAADAVARQLEGGEGT